jgi:nucleotide-binding universal stress UspA family protein
MDARPVVVAVDGSDDALRATEWAALEALRRSATLRVASVPAVPSRVHAYQGAASTVASTLRDAAAGAALQAARQAAEVARGLAIDTRVLAGPPAIAVAESGSGAVMLVVGARGAGGFGEMVLGSVSRHVAATAECPVVVVHRQAGTARREVIVGIRDPGESGPALAFAFEEAELRQARLVAMHAWEGLPPVIQVPGGPDDDTGPGPTVARQQIAAELAVWHAKYPAVTSTAEVVLGHPGQVLSIRAAAAELVVIGRRGDSEPSHNGASVGYVRHSVLSYARGPVVIVPA